MMPAGIARCSSAFSTTTCPAATYMPPRYNAATMPSTTRLVKNRPHWCDLSV